MKKFIKLSIRCMVAAIAAMALSAIMIVLIIAWCCIFVSVGWLADVIYWAFDEEPPVCATIMDFMGDFVEIVPSLFGIISNLGED